MTPVTDAFPRAFMSAAVPSPAGNGWVDLGVMDYATASYLLRVAEQPARGQYRFDVETGAHHLSTDDARPLLTMPIARTRSPDGGA